MKGFNPGKGTGMGSSMDMKKNSAMDMKRGSAMDMGHESPTKAIGVKMGGKFYPGIKDASPDSPQKISVITKGIQYGKKGFDAAKNLLKGAKKVKVKPKTTTTSTTSKVPTTTSKAPAQIETARTNKVPTMADLMKKYPNASKSKLGKLLTLLNVGVLANEARKMVFGSGSEEDNTAIQDAAKEDKKNTTPKKDPYAEAKKRDPNLDKYITERNKHKKGSDAYNAAQNKINRAYGVKKRHGVTSATTTKGRDTVSRKKVPGIVEQAKLVRERKIGGTKQIDQMKNLMTGESKERKRKETKEKERFYDAQGNLTRKTKDKKGKQKDIRKSANTVTKIKINKRTGKVKTKTRKRRGQKVGDFLASIVGK